MKDMLEKIYFNTKIPLQLRLFLVWLFEPVYLIFMGIWFVLVVYYIISGALSPRLLLLSFVQWNILTIIYQIMCNIFYKNNPKFIARKASRIAKQEEIRNANISSNKIDNGTSEE